MDFQDGIILNATYERDYLGIFRVRLVIKLYEHSWGVANMFFIGKDKINELFDDYETLHKRKGTETKLCDFNHKEIYMPPSYSTRIPDGLTFNFDKAQRNKFVKNCNGARIE